MAAGRRQFEIFVRNAQDEYITTIALHSAEEGIASVSPSSPCATDALPSRCVVEDYTRDASVLGTRSGGPGAVTMVSVKNADKLKSFRSYLAGRKKAGVVKLPGGGCLFLLPTTADRHLVQGESIVGLIQGGDGGGDGAAVPPPPPTPWSHSAMHSKSLDVPPPPPPRPAAYSGRAVSPQPPPRLPPPSPPGGSSKGGSEGGGGGGAGGRDEVLPMGGFLGSLMGSMDQTHKRVAGTPAVDRANRAQEQAIRQQVSNFEVEVREKIEAFSTDPAAISHTFPHVEKSLRSIQHSLAEDFDGITTRTEGEVDDRRVVLYKLGFEPPEEEVQVDAQVHIGLSRNTASSSSSVSAAPMPALGSGRGGNNGAGNGSAGDLVRIGTIVKDRRTVQDIEEESRKRRRGF
ncbi:unnamed protein product [Pylaiella littoralis]